MKRSDFQAMSAAGLLALLACACVQPKVAQTSDADRVEPLLKFDPRVEVDQNTNELAALSNSERANFLLLNLADDIVTEKRTAEEARAFCAKTLQLEAAGKSSSYLEVFLFEPTNEKIVTP